MGVLGALVSPACRVFHLAALARCQTGRVNSRDVSSCPGGRVCHQRASVASVGEGPSRWLTAAFSLCPCVAGGERRLGRSSAVAFPIRTPVLPDPGPTWDLTCHLRGGPVSTDSPTGALTPTFPMTCLPSFSAFLSAFAGASPSLPSYVLVLRPTVQIVEGV